MKSLITKLRAVVNDDSLEVLGRLTLHAKSTDKIFEADANGTLVRMISNEDQTITFTGGGWRSSLNTEYSTAPITLQAGVEKAFYVSNGDYDVIIPNKYALTKLHLIGKLITDKNPVHQYSLSRLYLSNLSEIRSCNQLTDLILQSIDTIGDIDSLSALPLTSCDLEGCEELVGDITGKIYYLPLTKVGGDFTESLRARTSYYLYRGLCKSSASYTLAERSCDFSVAPEVVYHIGCDRYNYLKGEVIHSEWKSERPSSYPIITFEGNCYDFGSDLDAMLINQAECTFANTRAGVFTRISVRGNRTSASDAAVATLKQKGLTITVNGTIL